MNIFEMLNLRYEYEEIIRQYPTDQDSTISGMKAFIQTGAKRNRFRPGFDRAIEIANTIVNESK